MPAFIDVCIAGLMKCLCVGFIEKLPRERREADADYVGFTVEEAKQAMTFILC